MLKTHLNNLLTYFAHPITNATSEGLNSKIQSLKHAGRGFRSFPQLPHQNPFLLWTTESLSSYPLNYPENVKTVAKVRNSITQHCVPYTTSSMWIPPEQLVRKTVGNIRFMREGVHPIAP
jgi:hypothetical protein